MTVDAPVQMDRDVAALVTLTSLVALTAATTAPAHADECYTWARTLSPGTNGLRSANSMPSTLSATRNSPPRSGSTPRGRRQEVVAAEKREFGGVKFGSAFFGWMTATGIAVLLTAFYNTQIVRGASYQVAAEGNRLRPVVIPAPRGTIYDRYSEVVATSIPGFSVTLLPGDEEVAQNVATTLRLAFAIGLYTELGDDTRIPGLAIMVVRVEREEQAEELRAAGIDRIAAPAMMKPNWWIG